jgi:gamma-polyglutamate biosynthesis protein CapA
LDCPLTDESGRMKGKNVFHCPPGMAYALSSAGFKGLFIANGHILDQGLKGVEDTFTTLREADILAMGVSDKYKTAWLPRVARLKGLRIAFITLSETGESDNNMMVLPLKFKAIEEKDLKEVVETAKKTCDVVIVSFHWGKEFEYFPTKHQRELAYAAVDAGADLVVGSHPHVLQPYEIRNKSFIAYSLGNFIYDQKRTSARESVIMTAVFTKQGLAHVEFLPVVIEDDRPVPVTGEKALKILRILAGERKVTITE